MTDQKPKKKLRKCKVCEKWDEHCATLSYDPGPPPGHVDQEKTHPSLAQSGAWILKCGRTWLT